MPRSARVAAGGMVYHVLNRANGRSALFDRDEDHARFEETPAEAHPPPPRPPAEEQERFLIPLPPEIDLEETQGYADIPPRQKGARNEQQPIRNT